MEQLLVILMGAQEGAERAGSGWYRLSSFSESDKLLSQIGNRCLHAAEADWLFTNELLVELDVENLLGKALRQLRIEDHAAFLEARRLGRDPDPFLFCSGGSFSSGWESWIHNRRDELQEWLRPEFGLAEHARMLELQAASLEAHRAAGLEASKGELAFAIIESARSQPSWGSRYADLNLQGWESVARKAFAMEATRRQLLCVLTRLLDGERGWGAARHTYPDPATGKPFRTERRPGQGQWLISDWAPYPGQVLEMQLTP